MKKNYSNILKELEKDLEDIPEGLDIDDDDDDDIIENLDEKVKELQKEKGFESVTAKQIENAIEAACEGEFMSAIRVFAMPIIKSVMPKVLKALLVLIVIFMFKWWLGLLCIIPFLLYVVWCLFAKCKQVAGKLGFDLISEIKDMLS